MIPAFLARIFGPHWRTSTIACATAFFAFVVFAPGYFPPLMVDISKYAAAGGMAALGIASKDSGANNGQHPEV